MKAFILGALAAALTTSSVSAQQVGGTYDVDGRNPDGRAYKGTADITFTDAQRCRFYQRTSGGHVTQGSCSRDGSILRVHFELRGGLGQAIYDIDPDGVLHGRWTVSNLRGVGYEVMRPRQ